MSYRNYTSATITLIVYFSTHLPTFDPKIEGGNPCFSIDVFGDRVPSTVTKHSLQYPHLCHQKCGIGLIPFVDEYNTQEAEYGGTGYRDILSCIHLNDSLAIPCSGCLTTH